MSLSLLMTGCSNSTSSQIFYPKPSVSSKTTTIECQTKWVDTAIRWAATSRAGRWWQRWSTTRWRSSKRWGARFWWAQSWTGWCPLSAPAIMISSCLSRSTPGSQNKTRKNGIPFKMNSKASSKSLICNPHSNRKLLEYRRFFKCPSSMLNDSNKGYSVW